MKGIHIYHYSVVIIKPDHYGDKTNPKFQHVTNYDSILPSRHSGARDVCGGVPAYASQSLRMIARHLWEAGAEPRPLTSRFRCLSLRRCRCVSPQLAQ